jgi:hypothetical protein
MRTFAGACGIRSDKDSSGRGCRPGASKWIQGDAYCFPKYEEQGPVERIHRNPSGEDLGTGR